MTAKGPARAIRRRPPILWAVSILFLVLLVPWSAALGQPSPEDYAIDYGAKVMQRHLCQACPGYVGQMLQVVPKRLGEIKDSSEIVVQDCHATLIAPDRVLTASHCLRRWNGTAKWSELADGDCSRAYSFYFPATDIYPYEEARCRRIVTAVRLSSGLPQLEPDDVLVQLERPLSRAIAPVWREPISTDEEVDIWGYNGEAEAYVHRTCRLLAESLLTPLDRYGEGAYVTLTCDGDVEPGCSGAGAFVDGNWRGLVSCGIAATDYGESWFGRNEVVISTGYCSAVGPTPMLATCVVTRERWDEALHDLYLSAIDRTESWIAQTKLMLEGTFPYARFEYVHGPRTLPPFSFTPGYAVNCVVGDLLPERGALVAGVSFDLSTFLPRYVNFNRDTTVRGVSMRSQGDMEQFNIGLKIEWADRSAIESVPSCPSPPFR